MFEKKQVFTDKYNKENDYLARVDEDFVERVVMRSGQTRPAREEMLKIVEKQGFDLKL